MIGAILAGASEDDIKKMENVGYNIGLAFQIQDDILDVVGDSAVLGKSVGSDEKNEKITYVSLKGLEESEKEQERLSSLAMSILHEFKGDYTFLSNLTEYLVTRKK